MNVGEYNVEIPQGGDVWEELRALGSTPIAKVENYRVMMDTVCATDEYTKNNDGAIICAVDTPEYEESKHKLYSITIDGVQYNVTKASTEFVCEECHLREICEEDFSDRIDVNHTICNLCSEFTEKGYCFKKSER